MSYKGRYFLETYESQQQGYRNILKDSICFQSVDTEDSYDALDPDKLLQCPYDKSHKIRACRFPYHLVKCRKNHPTIVQKLVTCPFNARHQVPREEISQHISSCDDKRCIEQDIANQVNNHRREVNVISSWQSPPCEEDWDKVDLNGRRSYIGVIGHAQYTGGGGAPANLLSFPAFQMESLRRHKLLLYEGTDDHSKNHSYRSGSNTAVGNKSHLASCLRAPKSMPYVLPWKNNA